MTGVSESSFSFVSYNHPPPGQCAGGTHPTGMHSCFYRNPQLRMKMRRNALILPFFQHNNTNLTGNSFTCELTLVYCVLH